LNLKFERDKHQLVGGWWWLVVVGPKYGSRLIGKVNEYALGGECLSSTYAPKLIDCQASTHGSWFLVKCSSRYCSWSVWVGLFLFQCLGSAHQSKEDCPCLKAVQI